MSGDKVAPALLDTERSFRNGLQTAELGNGCVVLTLRLVARPLRPRSFISDASPIVRHAPRTAAWISLSLR